MYKRIIARIAVVAAMAAAFVTSAMATPPSATQQVRTAMETAFGQVQTELTSMIVLIIPIAIGISILVLIFTKGWSWFKGFLGR